jgi:hypothetical protein
MRGLIFVLRRCVMGFAALALLLSLHVDTCGGHDHDHDDGRGVHVLCHCAEHVSEVPQMPMPQLVSAHHSVVAARENQSVPDSLTLDVEIPPVKRS